MKKTLFVFVVVISGLVISSCIDDDLKNLANVDYQLLAEDSGVTQVMYDDLFKVVDEEAKNGDKADTLSGKRNLTHKSASGDTCATLTLDIDSANIFPLTLTIDFGAGCTAINTNLGTSITRRGVVNAVFSGPYTQQGSTVTVTTNNYFVNDYKIDGTKIIENQGENNTGNLEFSVIVTNGVITKPDGGIINWASTRTHEWIAGSSTNVVTDGIDGICDDVYLIRGTGNGTISNGTTYSLETLQDLRKEVCCRRLTDGVLEYTVNGSTLGTINYETDQCTDLTANVEILDNQFVVIIQ